jgi:hypothetical protein
MNGRALRALVFGLGPPALIAACSLDVTGYDFGNDIPGSGAGGSASASASVTSVGAGGGGGSSAATGGAGGGSGAATGGAGGAGGAGGESVADAGPDVDVPDGDAPDGPTNMCDPTQSAPEKASAFPSTKLKVLDGKDDDWGCAEPLVLDATTAEVAKSPPGGTFTVSARVRLEWDSTAIYFFADVTNPVTEGADPTSPWKNDSVELYLRGGPAPLGDYGQYDHHYIVDHKGLVQEASPPAPPNWNPQGFLFSVASTPGGYAVEASVSAAAVGGNLDAGRKLGFDVLVSDGINQAYFLIWAIAQHGDCVQCTPGKCCCVNGGGPSDYPSCDTQVFGELSLLP